MTMCDRDVFNLFLSLYISDGKTKVKVIAGKSLGTKAVIDTHSPIMFLDIHVTAGGSFEQNVPKEYNAFAYVWRGAGSFTADKISVDMGKVNFPFLQVDLLDWFCTYSICFAQSEWQYYCCHGKHLTTNSSPQFNHHWIGCLLSSGLAEHHTSISQMLFIQVLLPITYYHHYHGPPHHHRQLSRFLY